MTRLETYKTISKKVDIFIRIFDYCKRKSNKPLAEFYLSEITRKIDQYYLFEKITVDARNYFINRISDNIKWFNNIK